MRALVIDDSRAMRRIISDILGDLGYTVSEAKHGIEALQRLEQHGAPDVVLVDWNMPEMDGLEFLRALRAKGEYADLPVMMVTTETEMEQMALAFMAGANEFVMKPFDSYTIEAKLQLIGVECKQ